MNKESYGLITGLTDEYAGRRLPLYADETIWFGSDPRNDTVLTGEKISPLHCGLSFDPENNCFWIACESEFGVLAEGEGWIRKDMEVRLPVGAQIRIGDYRFALSGAETARESAYRRSDAGGGFYREVPEESYKTSKAEGEYESHRTKNRSGDDGCEDARCGDARCDGDDSSEFSRRKSRIVPKYIGIGGSVAVILVVICIGICYVLSGNGSNKNNVDNIVEVNNTTSDSVSDVDVMEQEETLPDGGSNSAHVTIPEEYADQITIYDNGDFVYAYSEEQVNIDAEAYALYVENLVDVFLTKELTTEEKQALADQVNGTIVSDISGSVNMMQILVKDTDYAGVCACAELLSTNNTVRMAMYDVPFYSEDMTVSADDNPWSASGVEEDRGNEDNPDGNDWWAEAIGAYTAWSYDEWCTEDVSVGVIDSYIFSHEDLTTKILDGYTRFTSPNYKENPSAFLHGLFVAGIIGADDNDIGIRGVAGSSNHFLNLYCVDRLNYVTTDLFSNSATFAEMLKTMLENDVKVINLSWGTDAVYSEDKFDYVFSFWDRTIRFLDSGMTQQEKDKYDQFYNEYNGWSYETYLWSRNIYADSTASICIGIMIDLLESRDEGQDFLIVQAAGNGYNNNAESDPYPAYQYSGYFASVREELFAEDIAGYYSEIDEHILIVGAVENEISEGAYVMTSWSCYGPTVDICAPGGENIFALSKDNGYILNSVGGTSSSAPMVSGAAAVLWSIDPDLTAAEVRNLLLYNTKYSAKQSATGAEYPMLNVGAAVETLITQLPDNIAYGEVYNSVTKEPIEGATMQIEVAGSILSTSTDEEGSFSFVIDQPSGTYTFWCHAEGYEYGAGEVKVIRNTGEDGTEIYYLNEIYLEPIADSADQNMEESTETVEKTETIDLYMLEWNGHYYYIFYDICTTWEEAKVYCESIGGYLAVIGSDEENVMLYEYMIECGYQSAYFGYSDREEEGNWVWLPNESSTYVHWAEGEPNSENSNEDYAGFYWKYTDGYWNDADFGAGTMLDGRAFICEWASSDAVQNFELFDSESEIKEKENDTATLNGAYKELLQDIHDNPQNYMDLQELDGYVYSDIELCEFCIFDINQDGIDDLAVSFLETYTSSQYTSIWTLDVNGQIVPLGTLGASWLYYSNGYIKELSSHNHTYGDTIWPYSIKKYDSSQDDGFIMIASAYCVDKRIAGESGVYSEELDKDQDGVIYYFLLSGEDEVPLTEAEYNQYIQKYIPDSLETELQWNTITNENIASIE